MRRLLVRLVFLVSFVLSWAGARTIEIVSADQLELRKVDGQDLAILSGNPVELRIDDKDTIRASRVEYNRTKRTLSLSGRAIYRSFTAGANGAETEQVLSGDNLVVDLASQNLAGEDVIVATSDLEIRGADVERVPGQLKVDNGYFTLCARCGRTPNDYAFRAQRIFLYPGDRLVAYGATLLLADAPVMYLPVAVLLLGDKDRQPRFDVGYDLTDGWTLRLDLPFVFGTSGQGFSLLRYYAGRTPSIGFGVDLTAYGLPLGISKLDVYALANPRPVGDFGYDLDFRVNAVGQSGLPGSLDGISYTFQATRSDIGQSASYKGVTNVSFSAKVAYDILNATLRYENRFGPPPDGALASVLIHPELALDFNQFRSGDLSAKFAVTLGSYTAASNSASRLTTTLSGPNVNSERLLETHAIVYETNPWSDATLRVTNDFRGQYYTFLGKRAVDLRFGVSLAQRFGTVADATLAYTYSRADGVSPFAFDAVPRRPPSAVLSLGGNVRPFPWLQLSATQNYDFVQPGDRQSATTFGVALTPAPLSASATLNYNFFKGELQDWQVSATLGSNSDLSFSLSTAFARLGGYQPLNASVSYSTFDRAATGTFGVTYDLQKNQLSSLRASLNAVATRDAILNPVTLSADETLGVATPGISGNFALTWRGVSFTSSHNFSLPNPQATPDQTFGQGLGNLNFGLSGPSGAPTFWSLNYGGPYDLNRGGWTTPALTGRLSLTHLNQRLDANLSVNMPGLDQPYLELGSAALSGQFDLTPRVGVSGSAFYARARYGDTTSDTLTFAPLSVTLALGGGPVPGAYFTTTLAQSYTWQNGVAQNPGPIRPVFLLTVNRCCWALNFELNPLLGRVRLGLTLPGGGGTAFDFDQNGVQFPGLTGVGTNP